MLLFADIAEPFESRDSGLKPGVVVSLDPNNPGGVKLATTPYDRKVAGVVSGAGGVRPGLMLEQSDVDEVTGTHPVALTGKVYCWCDASNGRIEPGEAEIVPLYARVAEQTAVE